MPAPATAVSANPSSASGLSADSRPECTITVDGHTVQVPAGSTIWEAARSLGIEIPVLCHQPGVEPVGVCRTCVVDVGERVLAASCTRQCSEGMTVVTDSPTITQHRKTLVQLLLAEHPTPCERERTTGDCELEALGRRYGLLDETVAPPQESTADRLDDSSPVIAVDHSACILCDRCVRACDDVQHNDVIGRTGKGHTAQIAFDLNQPMGESTCVSCGECVASCPTGALTNKAVTLPILATQATTDVPSVCPYCGVGCAITYHLSVSAPVAAVATPRTSAETLAECDSASSNPARPVSCETGYEVGSDDEHSGPRLAPAAHKDGTAEPTILYVDGRESPVNHGRLCVKGRYGWDYTVHPARLTKPLIRREEFYPKRGLSQFVREDTPVAAVATPRTTAETPADCDSAPSNPAGPVSGETGYTAENDNEHSGPRLAPAAHEEKRRRKPGGIVDPHEVLPAFREATWDEALDLIAEKLTAIKQQHGSNALAGFGSAKCSNEEAYLFQKLMRAGLGTNNVDHCTRLCHASSVAALMETIGSGAVTNVFADVANSDVCLITGSNATANHPVAATFIKDAAAKGTRLIVVDPRRHELADHAHHFAQIQPGSDVAFYNGVMHVLIAENLIDREFIEQRTEGFAELEQLVVTDYSPEQAAEICGIQADEIREIARTIGTYRKPASVTAEANTPPAMLVFWGMGISQHTHGTDNARCLISLCLLTGNVGRPGTGLHPLRGQNNVQGASDAGLIPMVFPDYQPVADAAIREKFEAAWQTELDPQPGLTVVEITHAALDGDIRGMYILGENPFISDPNVAKVRRALASLDFLVVQDIFLTETAEVADVILPASSYFEKDGTYTNTDRRVQRGRKLMNSPGEAQEDWRIICEIGRRMGLQMDYEDPAEVFAEFTSLTENYQGLTYHNLNTRGKLWPCPEPDSSDEQTADGVQILFGDRFPTANGRGKFVACAYQPAFEVTDDGYPFVLTTGRVLEHWHTGSMTRRSAALDAIEPSAFASLHPQDLQRLKLDDGTMIRVTSRRGTITLAVRADRRVEQGMVFIPFHFREAAANLLTVDALDPFGKIPEFKYCAVRVEPAVRSPLPEGTDQ